MLLSSACALNAYGGKAPVSYWHPTHQAAQSLKDFLQRLPRSLTQTPSNDISPPRIPLVLRVGVAGHLHLPNQDALTSCVREILGAIKEYVEGINAEFFAKLFPSDSLILPSETRLLSQLACGFDQLAAEAALLAGFTLHTVLPGFREEFLRDIERTAEAKTEDGLALPQHSARARQTALSFGNLLNRSARILELDRDHAAQHNSEFTFSDYEQAGSIIVDHSDLVITAIHDGRMSMRPGGTAWMEKRALDEGIPLVRIPVERPSDAVLIWTNDEEVREEYNLFDPNTDRINTNVFRNALNFHILGADFDITKVAPGSWEKRYISTLLLRFNEEWWDSRWKLRGTHVGTQEFLGDASAQIDGAFKSTKAWADRNASATAQIVRGSFIIASILGIGAVFCSVVGRAIPGLTYFTQIFELTCLALIFLLIYRSNTQQWRTRWTSSRQIERALERAAWLALLGRSESYSVPSHMTQFAQDDLSRWTSTYLKAILRASSFPSIKMTANYLKVVQELVLQNLIGNQINYYEREIPFQHKSSTILGKHIYVLVTVSFLLTTLYFGLTYLLGQAQSSGPAGTAVTETGVHRTLVSFLPIVAFIGALLPAIANALSAVRSHGEYAQIAFRYMGSVSDLKALHRAMLLRMQSHGRHEPIKSPRSAAITRQVEAAANIMMQEVLGWGAVHQTKSIDPS